MDVRQVLGEATDALTVKRVFGELYERDGVTVIPVASLFGGGGGGSGEAPEGQGGSGSGGGFGVSARASGVFVIKDGAVSWNPALDLTRVILGGQLVAVAAILAIRSVLKARARRRRKA
jgi:uncharacterized spore protein YtfJ